MTATGRPQLVPAVLDAAMSARGISLIILIIVGLVALDLTLNEAFYIYNPSVVGNQRVPASDIVAASGIETLHILWLQPDHAVQSLLEALPELQSAGLWCGLPAECTIQVLEREPLFEWKQNQTRIWVDAEGVAFPLRGPTPVIPIVEAAPSVPTLLPGRRVTPELLSTMKELIRVLPEVKTFRYTVERGIEFTEPGGNWPVYVGVGSDMASRVGIWKALAANLTSRKVRPRFIDVRYPQAPYYGK